MQKECTCFSVFVPYTVKHSKTVTVKLKNTINNNKKRTTNIAFSSSSPFAIGLSHCVIYSLILRSNSMMTGPLTGLISRPTSLCLAKTSGSAILPLVISSLSLFFSFPVFHICSSCNPFLCLICASRSPNEVYDGTKREPHTRTHTR